MRDLQQGVPLADVADGDVIEGTAGDATVVLVRKGDEFFAVDAFCTHYHGPLKDGLVTGETIRCPWHHACFDLRTGSATAAPAMRPLTLYDVVRDGELVKVRAARSSAATALPARIDEHIVIIGAGAAGSFAATELRRIGFTGKVTLLTREERLPYDKPNLSKDYLAGRAEAGWIPLRTEEEYAADRIDLRLGTAVERLEPKEQRIVLAGGETIAFDQAILATGSVLRRLDVPTSPNARVHYLRTWPDADALIALAERAKSVVVIGASFIGLETAASLRERGLDVTVVGLEERPLERVLGRAIGDFIRRTHESHGVRFRLGHKPVAIEADRVVLDDGTSERCDFVVAGVGVLPDVSIAERAGLTVDRGIVVDAFLRTSAPNVLAAGDAARFPDPRSGTSIRVEHWVVAGRHGQLAARNAAAAVSSRASARDPLRQEPFTSVPFFWSQHYDLVFAYVGHSETADDVQLFGSLDSANAAAIYRHNGRVAAVATLFRDDVSLAVEAAMERGESDDAILDLVRNHF